MSNPSDVEDALRFLEQQQAEPVKGPGLGGKATQAAMSFREFANLFFQDKRPEAARHTRTLLEGPLVKQIWGDGDSERVLTAWVSILRFIGDLPPKEGVTNLQLVQHVCNIGITRPNTRDELYCQVIKQICDNPNKISHARAWILLALCCSTFLPTKALLGVLENFIAAGPPIYQSFVMERLERTIKMGMRKRPPTSLEIASCFTKNPIEMPVFFYTGTISHFGDAQTTAGEIISTVYADSRVKRDPGCSIFLCSRTMEQMTPLGSGRVSVMDAVFEYEALLENKGMDWLEIKDDVPWCIVFRKETFSPWIERPVNLELVYTQIMDGMERGTYICEDPERVALILAQRYYIQHGHVFDRSKLLRQIQLNPLAGMESISDQEWLNAVENVFKLTEFARKTVTIEEMKIETVSFARSRWPLEFSRKFMNCNVDASGQMFKNVTVLVNADGAYVMQASKAANRAGSYDREIFKIPFVQIAEVSPVNNPSDKSKQPNVTITSVFEGFSKYIIYTDDAMLFHETVDYMYKGCCFRSKYVMAHTSYKSPGDAFLSFDQGDMIVLPKIWAEADNGGWCTGICERTKKSGDFPSTNVFVIPSVSRPEASVIALFSKYASRRS